MLWQAYIARDLNTSTQGNVSELQWSVVVVSTYLMQVDPSICMPNASPTSNSDHDLLAHGCVLFISFE